MVGLSSGGWRTSGGGVEVIAGGVVLDGWGSSGGEEVMVAALLI